jgi:hypothetical protein
MERKDFNFLSPVEINIHSTEIPRLIRKKEKQDGDAFLLQQKRREEEWFIKKFLQHNPDAPLV